MHGALFMKVTMENIQASEWYVVRLKLTEGSLFESWEPHTTLMAQTTFTLCGLDIQCWWLKVPYIFMSWNQTWYLGTSKGQLARFIHTVCMCRIRWSCEGLTSVHNKYTGYTLKHLLLRHMYNLPLPVLLCYAQALRSETSYCYCWLCESDAVSLTLSHCTVRCFIYCLCRR